MEQVCGDHSGICARVKTLEGQVNILFDKWDSMNTKLTAALVALSLNLVGIVALLIMKAVN